MDEIQRADPRARRKAILLVVCGLLIGLVGIPLVESYRPAFTDWITRDPGQMESRLKLGFAALGVVFAVPVLGFAIYLWRLGDRIVRVERFPAPGIAVMRDTMVLRGKSARRRGRLMQVLAAILVSAAFGFAVFLWQLVRMVSARAP